MLKGTKIVDLSRIIVGPYATMILADFGCQVIKVQSLDGDPTRSWTPPYVPQLQTSAYFLSINRNKKSIALDFKQEYHRSIVYKMIEKADVVVQNFVPGTTQKLKIDYESLKKHNQKLIYCSISGYGDIGPLKDSPSFDNAIQAQAGFMHLTGKPNSEPFKMGFAITDVLTGLYASNAILAGLHYRNQNNKGLHIKTSLYECALAALINQSSNYLNGNLNPGRLGNHHPNIVPYGLYETQDSSIIICVGTQPQYQRMIGVLNFLQKFGKQKIEKFNSNQARVVARKQFDELLTAALKQFKAQQIIGLFRKNHIPCSKVNSIKQTMESSLAEELKIVKNVDGFKCVRSPIRTSAQDAICDPQKPPKLNQHASEILTQIGFSQQEISQYYRKLQKAKTKIQSQ